MVDCPPTPSDTTRNLTANDPYRTRCSVTLCTFPKMLEEASELRAGEASAKGFFKGSLFGMVGVSLMAVLWVGGSHVGDGSMTVRAVGDIGASFAGGRSRRLSFGENNE